MGVEDVRPDRKTQNRPNQHIGRPVIMSHEATHGNRPCCAVGQHSYPGFRVFASENCRYAPREHGVTSRERRIHRVML